MSRHHPFFTLFLGASAIVAGCVLAAETPASDGEIEEFSFNYVYSTVLGTGFYSTETERVFVMRVPLQWQVRQIDDRNTIDLLLPVSVGVRDLRDDDGEFEFPDRLMTASFFPGIAWDRQMLDNWHLVSSINAGVARDFEQGTTAWMYSASIRSYAWWDWGKHRLALGNRLLGAGQHIVSTEGNQGFVLLENGLDWNYQLPWTVRGYPLSSSIFFLWQHFIDDMNIGGISGESVELDNLYQLGFTFGFRETVNFGFIPLTRVGFSVIHGNNSSGGELRAVSLNLGFPLSYY
jgi:hypothetical protein